MIYTSEGTPLGEIRCWQQDGMVFHSSPGSSRRFSIRFADRAELEHAITGNATLRNYVAAMLQHDADYMRHFMTMLDKGLSEVEPDNVQDTNIRALLTGRPVAILRVSMRLDLKGLPAVNQSWNSLVRNILNADNPSSRDCANFTDVKFPIRLGSPKDSNEYNDGLIGFYREAEGNSDYDYSAFYTYQADGSNEFIVHPPDDMVLTADKTKPAMTLLLLMDPRAKLNVTSGILPKKSITVPASHYQDSYNSLELSFLTSPVLHHQEVYSEDGEAGIDLPLSGEADHDWLWIGRDATGWQEKKLLFRKAEVVPLSPLLISEGWLKLVKSKKKEMDEPGIQ
jgi:hypothetical protein